MMPVCDLRGRYFYQYLTLMLDSYIILLNSGHFCVKMMAELVGQQQSNNLVIPFHMNNLSFGFPTRLVAK